jgi:hypothetical protein
MKVGGLILLSVVAAAAILGAIFGESSKEEAVAILTVPWIMGVLFLVHGFGAWSSRSLRRRAVRSRLRRLRRQVTSPEEALSAYHTEQRAQRRRQAARRAERARVRREARPAGLVILLWLATILYMMLGAYLTDAATRAAYNAINGKTDIFVGADRPANVLLNVHVRAVQVEAIEPQFHPLQRAELLYLGTNSGSHVLYNRTARQAVIIPSGSVALRFDSPLVKPPSGCPTTVEVAAPPAAVCLRSSRPMEHYTLLPDWTTCRFRQPSFAHCRGRTRARTTSGPGRVADEWSSRGLKGRIRGLVPL